MSYEGLMAGRHFAGFEQITGLSAVKTLTIPAKARLALISVTGQDVRWREDGTDPTATVGMVLKAGVDPVWFPGNMQSAEFIEAAASAVMNVTYYR